MASANTETFSTSSWRKPKTSDTTNAAQASDRTTLLVSMMISVSLRRRDML
jgi:hypothetical protein